MPDFQRVEITFFLCFFFSSSGSDSRLASDMTLDCHHCDKGTFNTKRRLSSGIKELRKELSKECEGIPLFFYVVFLSSLFQKQHQLCGTVQSTGG